MKRVWALILAAVLVLGAVPFVVLPASAKIIGEVEGGNYGKIFWVGNLPGLDVDTVSCGFRIDSDTDADTALYYVNYNDVPPQGTITPTGITYDKLKGASALYSDDTTINIVLEHDWKTSRFITADCNINVDLNGHTWTVTGEDVMDTENKNVTVSGGTMIFENSEWGPIRATERGNLTIRDVTFRNCHCDESGVVYFSSYYGKLYMENVVFDNCYCDGWGGCVYIDNPKFGIRDEWRSQAIFKNCDFIDCHAWNGGGAIYVGLRQCDLTFEDCTFRFDRSDNYCGGVLYANGDDDTYRFRGCTAYGCYAADAGGFAFVGGLHNDLIGDPDFHSGDPYDMDTRSTVCGCYAIGSGGAIYVSNTAGYGHYCKINGFNFVQNTAGSATHSVKSIQTVDANEWGGALCLRGQHAEVERCDFIDNYSHYYGGGIYLGDNYSSVSYCVFRGNWSDPTYHGEDIFNDDSYNTVSDNIYYSDRVDTVYMYYAGTNTNNTHYATKTVTAISGLTGTGTASDPYLIGNSRAMLDLAMNVSAGKDYAGQYFRVTKDIGNVYVPIGVDAQHPFKGNFDGGGYGLGAYMRLDRGHVGVFGYAVSGTIRNLRVTEGFLSGTSEVGGICGTATDETFVDCSNAATVNSKNNGGSVGGIAGYVDGKTRFEKCSNGGKIYGAKEDAGGIAGMGGENSVSTVFDSCRNDGFVQAVDYAGGIFGAFIGEMTAKNCVNTGTVEARDQYAGGIVGFASFSCRLIVMNCVNSGRITAATSNAAGIVGYSDIQGDVRQILNCANYGEISAPKELAGILTTVYTMPNKEQIAMCGNPYPVDVINCYNDGEMPFVHNCGAIVGGMGLGNFVNCVCNGNRTVADDHATILTEGDHGLRAVRQLNVYLCDHKSETKDWVYWWLSPATGRAEPDFLSVEIGKYAGSGTENDPFVIEKTSDLRYLELELAQGKGGNVNGKRFLLKKDIAYAGTPIGDATTPFGGIFDGGGHTVTVTVRGYGQVGLFGVIRNATVENLNVTGMIEGDWSNVGGVVGESYDSTIRNCSNSATVRCAHYAGGIAGAVSGTKLTDCTNHGTVIATGSNAAGIAAGTWKDNTVTGCCNNGPVSAAEVAAGGILGAVWDGCTVLNCVNTQKGTVEAGANCAGGIVGNLLGNGKDSPRIENCANHGSVSTGSSVGGIVHNACPKTIVKHCFSGGRITATDGYGYAAIVQGVQVDYPNCYFMVGIGHNDAKATAVESKKCGPGLVETINKYLEAHPELKNEWTLWGLDAASHLASPLGTEKEVTSLAGLGSEEEPYLIKNAADLIELSTRLGNGLDTKATHYRLISDISDYVGAPIGTKDDPFVGVFDGNGYTVHIKSVSGAENVGFFGWVNGGTVTNLSVTGEVNGNLGNTGAVVGTAKNAQIVNCASIATVNGASQVGGIVGNATGTTVIANCYASSVVIGTGKNVGGIAGKLSDSSTVRNCIKIETVTGSESVGGIVGGMDGKGCAVENCGHYGNVTGTGKLSAEGKSFALGGIVGKAANGGKVFLCFLSGRIGVDSKNGGKLVDGSYGIMIGEKAADTACDALYYYKAVVDAGWNVVGNDAKVTADARKEADCKKRLMNIVNGIVSSHGELTEWTLNKEVGSMACPGNFAAVKHKGVSGTASVFAENAPVLIAVCSAVTAAGVALALAVGLKKRGEKR